MNADLRVGGVQETVTVTGEAPVVDVTSARTEQTIDGKTVSEIPTSRLYSSLTQLVPALNVQGNDVGGSQGNVFSVFQIHGGRRNERQVLVDGMSGGYQGNWSGHTGFTTVAQGSVSYVTGSHSAKFGARFHQNDSTFPKNYYNNTQLEYFFRGGVPYQMGSATNPTCSRPSLMACV